MRSRPAFPSQSPIDAEELHDLFSIVPDKAELMTYSETLQKWLDLEAKHRNDVKVIMMGRTKGGHYRYRVEIGQGMELIGMLADAHSGSEPFAYTTAYYWGKWRCTKPSLLRNQKLVVFYIDPDLMVKNEKSMRSKSLFDRLFYQRREHDPTKQPDWSFKSRSLRRASPMARMIKRSMRDLIKQGHHLRVWVVGHDMTVSMGTYFGIHAHRSEKQTALALQLEELPLLLKDFSPDSPVALSNGAMNDVPVSRLLGTEGSFPLGSESAFRDYDHTTRVGRTSTEAMSRLVRKTSGNQKAEVVGISIEVCAFLPRIPLVGPNLRASGIQSRVGPTMEIIRMLIERGLEIAETLPKPSRAVKTVLAIRKRSFWGKRGVEQNPNRTITIQEFQYKTTISPLFFLRPLGDIKRMLQKHHKRLTPEQSLFLSELMQSAAKLFHNARNEGADRVFESTQGNHFLEVNVAENLRMQLAGYQLTTDFEILERRLDPWMRSRTGPSEGMIQTNQGHRLWLLRAECALTTA